MLEENTLRHFVETITDEEFDIQMALGLLDAHTIVLNTTSLHVLRHLMSHDNYVIARVAQIRYDCSL